MSSNVSTATNAVRAAIESDTQHGAVVPPLHLSSNFAFEGLGAQREYDYTRSGNPTRDALAEALTALEGGSGAVVTSSGMAALMLITHFLEPGQLLVAPHDCYGGTFRLFTSLAKKGHFELEFVDQTDLEAVQSVCARGPGLILTETPSNPLLRIVDIEAVAGLADACGALFVVDNTFLSPALQQPLSLGADLVLHSTTKYINGHSDVVGGCVVAGTPELAEELSWWANCLGITGAPFDSFMTLRGLRTLNVRVREHEASATLLANILEQHDSVRRVYYPGLESHPGHDLARRQQKGFGGMVSFEVEGNTEAVRAFVDSLELFSLAESLGGVESLVCHPPSMTHAAVTAEALADAGVSQNLVRLSVGLESAEDLVADVLRALEAAQSVGQLEPVAAA
jgi:cystathionine gamma-synthase